MEIYDTSDVQRMLFQLSERRRKQKEEQTKRVQGGTKIATEGFKMWSKDQSIKTAELLNEGAALNPEYRDAGFVKRTFTPASERVTFDPSTTQGTDIGTVSPAGTVPPVTAPPAGAAPQGPGHRLHGAPAVAGAEPAEGPRERAVSWRPELRRSRYDASV